MLTDKQTSFCSNSIFGLPPGNPLEATLHTTEETTTPALSGLPIAELAGVFNYAQLDDAKALSKSSAHHARLFASSQS